MLSGYAINNTVLIEISYPFPLIVPFFDYALPVYCDITAKQLDKLRTA